MILLGLSKTLDLLVYSSLGAAGAKAETLNAAQQVHDFSMWNAFVNAAWPEQVVMVLLLLFSVISWAVIASKWTLMRQASKQNKRFQQVFWDSERFESLIESPRRGLSSIPLFEVFQSGYSEYAKLRDLVRSREEGEAVLESVERAMQRSMSGELSRLERMLPFLATTGATAPFIGLFGAVVGIMSAFNEIGRLGNADLATVAPGIGGALVATAAGLFAAIPAVMAYNFFLSKIHEQENEMENFSADFLNVLRRRLLADA